MCFLCSADEAQYSVRPLREGEGFSRKHGAGERSLLHEERVQGSLLDRTRVKGYFPTRGAKRSHRDD